MAASFSFAESVHVMSTGLYLYVHYPMDILAGGRRDAHEFCGRFGLLGTDRGPGS